MMIELEAEKKARVASDARAEAEKKAREASDARAADAIARAEAAEKELFHAKRALRFLAERCVLSFSAALPATSCAVQAIK